jgi:hypothetical protein
LDEGSRLRLRMIACSAFVNRPVRTRMPGGVGGAGAKPAPTRLAVLTET